MNKLALAAVKPGASSSLFLHRAGRRGTVPRHAASRAAFYANRTVQVLKVRAPAPTI